MQISDCEIELCIFGCEIEAYKVFEVQRVKLGSRL